MKQFLIPHLVCPACLPAEIPLDVSSKRINGDDVISGELFCKKCNRRFPIKDGIAHLIPDPESFTTGGQLRYDERETLNRYLWSHYADLAGNPEVSKSNTEWTSCLAVKTSSAFDAGCAVGRLTFEMASRSDWSVGCDLSLNFIRMARRLAHERCCSFSLPLEGNLRESFQCELPASWSFDKVEFIVANAMAVPFANGVFQQISSLNVLDRVSYPLAHLYEMNRVAQKSNASFLFADPFSWNSGTTAEDKWLGGTANGKYPGRGLDNVRALLKGKDKIIDPAWRVIRETQIPWMMRTHSNHSELITSEVLVSNR